jgi:phosphatidyl-myo-inositol dimannoside synthase
MSRRPRLGLIAYEYPPFIGGMTTYGRALALHMRERGYDVHVFANREAVPEDGFTVYPVLTTDLARDLPALIPHDMDLWHSINFGYAPLAALKRPFVLTVHGNDFLSPWVRLTMDRLPFLWRAAPFSTSDLALRAGYAWALRCVDQVLACSHFSAGRFRLKYPSVRRLQVVPNGVDESCCTDPRSPRPGQRHPRRLLTVCTLSTAGRRKNVDGCIRAMALAGRELDLEYHVVGDGSARPELEALAAQLNVADRVRFLGRVDDRTLRDEYASASLFVLVPRPRPGDVEGFGIVYIEAAAAGTPALGGKFGGATDAILDGQSGFFADDASPEAIAAAFRRFFTGQIRFDETVVRGQALRHTWPTVLQAVERVYERLLPGHRRRPPWTASTESAGLALAAT